MRVAKIKVDFKAGPFKKSLRINLHAKPGAAKVVVKGTQADAIAQAMAATRREHRSWAVIQAGRGVYELVPAWINKHSDDPQIEDLGDLTDVPGLRRVSVERTSSRVVAITGESKAYVLTGDGTETIGRK